MGSPSALATAARIIADCAHETGLELRWKKCHLYGTPTTIDKCRSLQNPSFPTTITFNADLNIEYLKTPIGSDGFVNLWMTSKLQELTQAINSISAMKWKHEAATLLKHCGTFCRVVHLMRTVPPRQIEAFIGELDSTIRGAFEGLLGTHMSNLTWTIAKLPPKYGGMGWRQDCKHMARNTSHP